MLEFTGERFIPGQGGARIAYEHLHRYLFALGWARGADVLDLASGSGYGALLLAAQARRVWGLEQDDAATRAAVASSTRTNVVFVRADALRLPLAPASLDVVVAFELIEHLPDRQSQEMLVAEIARVLRPEGVALVSTPDRAAYSDARDYRNPYHFAELYRDEFAALLAARFTRVDLFTQQVRAGSLIAPLAPPGPDATAGEVFTAPAPGPGRGARAELYLVAVCERSPAARAPVRASTYLDPTDFLLEENAAEIADCNAEVERLGAWGRELGAAVAKHDEKLRAILAEIEARDRTIRDVQAAGERELAARDETAAALARALAERDRDFDARGRWAAELDARVADRDRTLAGTVLELEETLRELRRVEAEVARIRGAWVYRVLRRLGILP